MASDATAVVPTMRRRRMHRAAGACFRDTSLSALIVFVGAEFVALLWWLHIGRDMTFASDEWVFVTESGYSLHGLFAPYNAHWVTLPALAYRLLWQLFGLRSHTPYVLVTISLHLIAAGLLRVVMRRMGVNPWIATAAVLPFLFFGAGAFDVLISVQMAFVGALVFGLVHLLLADHDGPVDRRDAIGIGAGLAALMCSGVGVAMVAVVGVATTLRRGWRIAAFHVVPLAAVFLVWWAIAHDWSRYRWGSRTLEPGSVASFVRTGIGATFDGVAQVPGVAWVLGAILVAGLVAAWAQTPVGERRTRFAIAASLLVGASVFLLVTAVGRASLGAAQSQAGRYLHIQAALLLPVVAFAADALVRRWRLLFPVVIAALLVGIPGNLSDGRSFAAARSNKDFINRLVGITEMPVARRLPRSTILPPTILSTLTIGWLLDAHDSGRLPEAPPLSAEDKAQLELQLSGLVPQNRRPGEQCRPLLGPVRLDLDTHESLGHRGGRMNARILDRSYSGPRSVALPAGEYVVAAGVRPLTVSVASASAAEPAELCT